MGKIVEFLIPGETEWTAGVVNFASGAPEITQPDTCQTCHGSFDKPLWTGYAWPGTEFPSLHNQSLNLTQKPCAIC